MTIVGRLGFRLAAIVAFMVAAVAPAAAAPVAANPELIGYANGIQDEDNRVAASDLVITRLQIDINQRGGMVDMVVEAVLSNRIQSDGEPIEARFGLGLPSQAVVTGYALDIGGVMVAGTLLDQPKARRVYEAEVRKGIDPGLAEVSGNMFRTRVYPIAAQESRTIRVSFSAPADAMAGFVLPLQGAEVLGPVVVRYTGTAIRGTPAVTLPWGGALAVRRAGIAWKGEATAQSGTALTAPLRIAGFETPTALVVSQHDSRQNFFELAAGAPKPVAAGESGRLRVYWDRSWSRADDRTDLEMAFLGDYLARNPAATIDLVSFAEDTPVVTSFTKPADLRTALLAQRYLGATRLTGLDGLKLAAADTCLIFTDGSRTLDPMADFAPDCRLHVVTSAADADTAWLSNLAQDSGGQLLVLTADNWAQAAAGLSSPGPAIVRVRSASGRRIAFRSVAAAGGGWHIVGPMLDEDGVRVWVAGANGRVTIEQFDWEGVAERHNGAGALWAAGEVARLSDDPVRRDEMVKLARKYQVASASLAFLVLESPEQYVAADVDPPKAGFDDDWRANYREMRKDKDDEAQEARGEHLDMVRRNWAERKQWSAQRFNAHAKPKKSRADEEAAAEGADAAAAEMSPPPPPPPSPAAAPGDAREQAEPTAVAEEEADAAGYEIVVTSSRRQGSVQETPLAISAISAVTVGDAKIEVADLLSTGPYIKALAAAPTDTRDAVLFEQAKLYGTLAGFWLDVAEWYRAKGDDRMAARLLLTALDAPTADDETRQIVAFRLQRDGQLDDSIALLERMAVVNAERPQPRRLLALALAQRGAPADLERAFALLTDVALTPFNSAFEGIDVVALMEANGLIARLERAGLAWKLDPEFVAPIDTDVRIVIEWTNDDADIDLWVIEPNGERVYYSHKLSAAGGTISNDMTDGYGPEEYVVRRASAGDYQVRIHGYSPDRINPNGTGRVTVRLIRDFGRPTQRDQLVDAEIGFKDEGGNGDGSRAIAKLTVPKAQ
ncbi:MAG: hypothetical protein JHD35_18745 [Sphingopyxis sp.]|nr:hypothetical protein [Sphingopyxis sp.]